MQCEWVQCPPEASLVQQLVSGRPTRSRVCRTMLHSTNMLTSDSKLQHIKQTVHGLRGSAGEDAPERKILGWGIVRNEMFWTKGNVRGFYGRSVRGHCLWKMSSKMSG